MVLWFQIQGWYNRLQRDEVVAVWKKIKGKMTLHVHCHISSGHILLNFFAKLRYYIFCRELPVVSHIYMHTYTYISYIFFLIFFLLEHMLLK